MPHILDDDGGVRHSIFRKISDQFTMHYSETSFPIDNNDNKKGDREGNAELILPVF